jgi:signal transduction histidine kinase/ActR/RegA family two-component response regulator
MLRVAIVSIRSRLVLLVLAVLAPTLIAASLAIVYVYSQQLGRLEQGMREATRALALALDRDIARRDAIIATLAVSPALARGDFDEFYEQAKRVVPNWDNSIILVDPSGRQVLNTRIPLGQPLPTTPELASPLARTHFDVSGLYRAPLGNQWSFSVRRPVYVDGRLVYFIAMGSFASQIDQVLTDQGLPDSWLGTVMDARLNIVARSRNLARFIGAKPTGPLAERVAADSDGFLETVSLDGTSLLSFFSEAPTSGWTVVIGVPLEEIHHSVYGAMFGVGVGALLLIGIATALAFGAGRTITRPLRLLDAAAQALGRGEVPAPQLTGLAETDRTAAVLAEAGARIHNANAEMAAQVAAAVDKAERSLKALQQGQKLEALGRLTGGIAHDFNNLLQTLTIGLQVVDMAATEPRAKKALEACQRSVERGTRLTRQLMAFGRYKVDEIRQVDLRELLLGMGDLLDGALPSRIELRLELPERPWPVVLDPLQCELAVLNIVFNARDAMPGGGRLVIALAQRQLADQEIDGVAGGACAELSIADNGHGMSEEVMARVFEPFFTTKEVGEGTGLGLAQVYGFASQSGGKVLLESTPNVGTRVALLLPLASAAEAAPAQQSLDLVHLGHSARVLLVDDDTLVRDVVVPALREMGYVVEIAGSADAALSLYRQSLARPPEERFDIVFSDIVMPGELDGIGLALELRTLTPDLPILLATGYSERAPADYGFTVLSKPYDIAMLVEALRNELAAAPSAQT